LLIFLSNQVLVPFLWWSKAHILGLTWADYCARMIKSHGDMWLDVPPVMNWEEYWYQGYNFGTTSLFLKDNKIPIKSCCIYSDQYELYIWIPWVYNYTCSSKYRMCVVIFFHYSLITKTRHSAWVLAYANIFIRYNNFWWSLNILKIKLKNSS